ncbi:MAG: type I-E CRISPR-associated protein Cas7/Cse4/CasC, partial [Pseudomonadota bacterium]
RALEAFVEAFALASPSGKKNSFANHVRAEFLLATLGDQQPLTLANAFLNPVRGGDLMVASIAALESRRNAFTAAYGPSFDAQRFLNVRAADMKTESVFASGAAPLSDVAAFGSGGMDALPFHGPAA